VPAGPLTDASILALQTEILELMAKRRVPGVAIAMIHSGKRPRTQSFGVKNVRTNEPVTNETIFEAASLSKPAFTYGVLKLVDQGKLGLDVPLTTYLPKPYVQRDERLGKITARIVLSHRTGFPNWRGDGPLTIHFTPGERFSYSGEGYVYLQRVVEQITGTELNTYMTSAVFKPLGMTSSSYVWRPDFDARSATGHNAAGEPVSLWKPNEAGAASTLNTTASDYALFLEAVLHRRGLKAATFREMEKPQIALDPECRNCLERAPKQLSKSLFWGLGWGIQRTEKGDALWHWGDNNVFKAFVIASPKTKDALALFANSENGMAIARPITAQALGAEPLAFQWLKYDS
jgi:CubicO group peptidase (beta-lactamase class C family)